MNEQRERTNCCEESPPSTWPQLCQHSYREWVIPRLAAVVSRVSANNFNKGLAMDTAILSRPSYYRAIHRTLHRPNIQPASRHSLPSSVSNKKLTLRIVILNGSLSLLYFVMLRFMLCIYRYRLKSLYVVARNFFLLLLNCSVWPCLGPA